jgi:hypothetical protein
MSNAGFVGLPAQVRGDSEERDQGAEDEDKPEGVQGSLHPRAVNPGIVSAVHGTIFATWHRTVPWEPALYISLHSSETVLSWMTTEASIIRAGMVQAMMIHVLRLIRRHPSSSPLSTR